LCVFIAATFLLYAEPTLLRDLVGGSSDRFKNYRAPRFRDLLVITGVFAVLGFGVLRLSEDLYLKFRITNLCNEIGAFASKHPEPELRWEPNRTVEQRSNDEHDYEVNYSAYIRKVGPEFDNQFRSQLYDFRAELINRGLETGTNDQLGPFLTVSSFRGAAPSSWGILSNALEKDAAQLPRPQSWLNREKWLFAVVPLLIGNVLLWLFTNALVLQLKNLGNAAS
jgi:hypothetical protein